MLSTILVALILGEITSARISVRVPDIGLPCDDSDVM